LKVLIIGSGGREHAIAWRLHLDGAEVYACPGNPGIDAVATRVPPPGTRPQDFVIAAQAIQPDFVLIGPEAPLVAGVADLLRAAGFSVVGPSQAAAQLEGSKIFTKQTLDAAGIPTAAFHTTRSIDEARQILAKSDYPIVLKADGLAAGKGVIIANNQAEAEAALLQLDAALGPNLVIEEFLTGEEASFIVLSDGTRALPLEASQDHKTIFDDDRGPNTGGMGSYTDGRILTPEQQAMVMDRIIHPTLDYMRHTGTPFSGFLYAGLMMTAAGPKVLEYNVRLGDPETQSLLHRIESGFADTLHRLAKGSLEGAAITWRTEPSVCVVLASQGYPDTPRTGDAIRGIPEAQATGATVFHSGTRREDGVLKTAGGRVLGVTSRGDTLAEAISNTYRAVDCIQFDGMQVRRDIGRKGLKRW
jgi:phosphoribosylamine---glycine ligase